MVKMRYLLTVLVMTSSLSSALLSVAAMYIVWNYETTEKTRNALALSLNVTVQGLAESVNQIGHRTTILEQLVDDYESYLPNQRASLYLEKIEDSNIIERLQNLERRTMALENEE